MSKFEKIYQIGAILFYIVVTILAIAGTFSMKDLRGLTIFFGILLLWNHWDEYKKGNRK